MTKTRDWLLDAIIEGAIARHDLGDQLNEANRALIAERRDHDETKRVLKVVRDKRKQAEQANHRLCNEVQALGTNLRTAKADLRIAKDRISELERGIAASVIAHLHSCHVGQEQEPEGEDGGHPT